MGYTAQYVLEDLAHIPVRVEPASEFRYRTLLAQENTLVIVISQSGETADSLAALRQASGIMLPFSALTAIPMLPLL